MYSRLLDVELDVRNTPPNLDPRLSLQAVGRVLVMRIYFSQNASGILCMQTAANKLENLRNFN